MKALRWLPIITLIFSVFSCTKEQAQLEAPVLLPSNASVVLRINNLSKVEALNDTAQLPVLSTLPFDVLSGLYRGTWTGALAPSGANKMDWIWTIKAPLDSAFSNGQVYNDYTVYHSDSLYAVGIGNIWAISYNEGLIKDAINQYDRGYSLLENGEFSKLWNNASNADALNIFLQHEELGEVGRLYLQQDWTWVQHLATWSEIDIALRKGKVLFTSVSVAADSTGAFLSIFDDRASGAEISPMIANSALYAVSMRTGAPAEWLRGFNSYRGKKQRLKQAVAMLEVAGIDPKITALSFEGTFARVGYGEGTIALCRLEDADDIEVALNKLSASTRRIQGQPAGTLSEQHRFLFSALFGWFFTDLGTPSWTIADGWLVLASEEQLLDIYMGEIALDKTWAESAMMSAMAEKMDQNDHFAAAIPVRGLAGKFGFPETLPSYLERAVVGGSLDIKDDLAFGSAQLTSEKSEAPMSSYLWSSALDGSAVAGPWWVKNHRTGTNDVVVQDANNTLYWLNGSGEVLWKKVLDGTIVGELDQVDLYQNNKYQLIFTTSNKLWCIDLLGRAVENFPVSLPGETQTGVSVMDYDKNRSYRFLIAVGDQLYNYTADGKKVSGWKTDAAGSTIIQAPILFQRGGKDYIITATEKQAVVLNRRGERRLKTADLAASSAPWTVLSEGVPALVRPSLEGTLLYQRLDGTFDNISDPLGSLQGVAKESYGLVVWNDEAIEVRAETGIQEFEVEGLQNVRSYPGGTGILVRDGGTIEIVLLNSGERITTFTGQYGIAGRFSDTGAPVIVLRDGSNLIAYEL
ncbi:MAG: hypothetical protein RL754_1313 [Bacteroidota bacterium]|jgi:hypothetical protein